MFNLTDFVSSATSHNHRQKTCTPRHCSG